MSDAGGLWLQSTGERTKDFSFRSASFLRLMSIGVVVIVVGDLRSPTFALFDVCPCDMTEFECFAIVSATRLRTLTPSPLVSGTIKVSSYGIRKSSLILALPLVAQVLWSLSSSRSLLSL